MIVFSYYPSDPRVRREAEALASEGAQVDVICLRDAGEAKQEQVRGVRIHRLPVQRSRSGKLSYLWEYGLFICLSFLKISQLHLQGRYRIVHVHNMPDILVLAALLPRLSGAKLILDLHDPMPEVYITKYSLRPDHPVIRLLKLCERFSIKLAHAVLTPNIAFRNLFVSRGCPAEKIHIVMNSPQTSVFKATQSVQPHQRSTHLELMYHGTIVKRHGLDTALEAIGLLRKKIPGLRFNVYGNGDYKEEFLKTIRDLHLEKTVIYHGQVTLETIAEAIGRIDIGLIPNKRSVFTEINMPTRIFEYLCQNKPVIAPRTQGIGDYFAEDALCFFEAGQARSLADAILRLHNQPSYYQGILKKAVPIYQAHSWELERGRLLKVATSLLQKRSEPIPAATGTFAKDSPK
jgi:glycosyltransferase involved in cell wall biosynthesis